MSKSLPSQSKALKMSTGARIVTPGAGERVLHLLRDARRARTQGPDAIEERQRARLAEMVAYARAQPVTNKKQLRARFFAG